MEAERLLTFSAFRMGAHSRWALIGDWALIRINTVVAWWYLNPWFPMQRSIFTPTVQLLHTIHKPQKRPKHSLIFSELFDEGTAVESPLYIRNNRFSGSRKSCAKNALVQERYKVVEPVNGFSRKWWGSRQIQVFGSPLLFSRLFSLIRYFIVCSLLSLVRTNREPV